MNSPLSPGDRAGASVRRYSSSVPNPTVIAATVPGTAHRLSARLEPCASVGTAPTSAGGGSALTIAAGFTGGRLGTDRTAPGLAAERRRRLTRDTPLEYRARWERKRREAGATQAWRARNRTVGGRRGRGQEAAVWASEGASSASGRPNCRLIAATPVVATYWRHPGQLQIAWRQSTSVM